MLTKIISLTAIPSNTVTVNSIDPSEIMLYGLKLTVHFVNQDNVSMYLPYLEKLVETQKERSLSFMRLQPKYYSGYLFFDRDKIVGQFFQTIRYGLRNNRAMVSFQPIYLIVHPDYQKQNISRLIVAYLLQSFINSDEKVRFVHNIYLQPYRTAIEHMRKIAYELGGQSVEESSTDSPFDNIAYLLEINEVRQNLKSMWKTLGFKESPF